jgi:hypothetical protein
MACHERKTFYMKLSVHKFVNISSSSLLNTINYVLLIPCKLINSKKEIFESLLSCQDGVLMWFDS